MGTCSKHHPEQSRAEQSRPEADENDGPLSGEKKVHSPKYKFTTVAVIKNPSDQAKMASTSLMRRGDLQLCSSHSSTKDGR